jgi:hypothetical protein
MQARRSPPVMRRRQLALLLAALALVACGDDDNGDGDESGPTPNAAADAKSDARNLVAQVETCYANEQSYTPCDDPEKLREAGVPLGSGEGQVEVKADSATSYTITARPEGGGEFTLTRDSTGMTKRECTPEDMEGCNNGSW